MKLADPQAIAEAVLADVYPPRTRPPVDLWCEAHRRLGTGGAASASRGMWDTGRTPYLRQMFRNLTDPKIHEITVKKSSQVGFSELLIGAALYVAGEVRQPGLIGYPTRDEARDFNKKRLIPALHQCDATARMIASARDTTDTEIRLGGVPLWFSWAQSVKTFKSDPVGWIFLDEIDEYPAGGQVLSNARDRQRTFHTRKLLKGSTPEDEDADGFVTQEYLAAQHRYRFLVPCPITGEFFELYDFGLIRWHGGRTADPDEAARRCWLQSPHVHVPKHKIGLTTEGRVDELHKPWMVRHGVWVRQGEEIETTDEWREYCQGNASIETPDLSTVDGDFLREPARGSRFSRALAAREPDAAARRAAELVTIVGGEDGVAGRIPAASHVAYRINALASLIDAQGWGGIVRKGLRENFGPDWQKGTLGQAPSIRGDITSVRHLADRCTPEDEGGYPLWTAPEPLAWVSVGVDVQKVCVYVSAIAFGDPADDPAVVGACRIERDERFGLRDIEDDLAGLRFSLGGASIAPMFLGVDAGFWTRDVYALVERLREKRVRAWSTLGRSGRQTQTLYRQLRIDEKDEQGRETGRTHDVLEFHTDRWMTSLYGLLSDTPEGSGPNGADLEADGLAMPRRMRMPAPFATDTGRVSADSGDFLNQITAERRVTEIKNGRPVQVWKLRREGLANHYGDTLRIAMAGAAFRGADMLTREAIERLRAKATRTTDPTPTRQTVARPDSSGSRPRRAATRSPSSIVGRLYSQ